MSTTLSDRDEQLLIRRFVATVSGIALLTVPAAHIALGATESWVAVARLVVLGGAFALLGRTRLRTIHVVVGAALLLWAAATISVSMNAVGVVSGVGAGVGLGTGMLWLAVLVGPALFLVMEVRQALVAMAAALLGSVGILAVVTGGQLRRVLAHDGVWQLVVGNVMVLCVAAAVAWLAGRSADERRRALLLRTEHAERTARLEAGQRRRAVVFSRTATALQSPMGELSAAAAALHAGNDASPAAEDGPLARVEEIAGDLLDRVVEHIDGLVAGIRDGGSSGPRVAADRPPSRMQAAATTTLLLTFGVFAMVALDAGGTVLLASDGVPDAHAAAAGANRMTVVVFLAVAVVAVRLPGQFGWWLSGLVLMAHPIAVLGLVDPAGRDALLGPYAAAWRVAVLAAGMLALLAVIIDRRVRDRDAHVAAATDEETRSVELERHEQVAELAYAEAAHELKNPLTVITGSARTLRQHGDDLTAADAERLRTALARAVERLDARLAVMRDVARGGGGTHGDGDQTAAEVARQRPVAAADVLLDALAASRVALGDQLVDVEVRVTGAWTSAAPEAVEHVLENLLSNADKYGDPDGVVRLTAHREDREIVVEVANQGSDLAPGDVERIFEPYWRAANAGERADGTGIGLAVVARLVEQWGGRCWVRVAGRWTRAGFTLPVAEAVESVQAPTWQQLQDQLD